MDTNATLIAATIEDLLQARNGLERRRARVNERIAELDKRISAWRGKLPTQTNGDEKKRRRSKKECLLVVEAVFGNPANGASGFSIRQVADAAGIPWSTARNVLRNNHEFEEKLGLWRRRTSVTRTRIATTELLNERRQ